MKTNILVGAVALIVLAAGFFFFGNKPAEAPVAEESSLSEMNTQEATTTPAELPEVSFVSSEPAPQPVVCAADALICPDGSGVGRTGPKCAFAPCPGTEISGTLKKDEEGFFIENLGSTIRMTFGAEDLILPFYGKVVRVLGAYAEGNIFDATTIEKYDAARGTLSMGQSKIINGVSVTLLSVEDSRCPSDVECVQPDNFTAYLRAQNDSGEAAITLSYEDGEESFDGHVIKLVDADPATFKSTETLTQEHYQVTVTVK
jgi:hypothetical protein